MLIIVSHRELAVLIRDSIEYRKPASIGLIATKFFVNGKDTRSKMKKGQSLNMSEEGKVTVVLAVTQSTEASWGTCEECFSVSQSQPGAGSQALHNLMVICVEAIICDF